jgi:hypothetical protein
MIRGGFGMYSGGSGGAGGAGGAGISPAKGNALKYCRGINIECCELK